MRDVAAKGAGSRFEKAGRGCLRRGGRGRREDESFAWTDPFHRLSRRQEKGAAIMTATMKKGKRSTAKRPARRVPPRPPAVCELLVPPGTHFDTAPREAWLKLSQKEREALVKAGRGSLSHVKYSVDEFIAEKRAEAERENRS